MAVGETSIWIDGSWWQAQVRLEVESVLGKFTEFGN